MLLSIIIDKKNEKKYYKNYCIYFFPANVLT